MVRKNFLFTGFLFLMFAFLIGCGAQMKQPAEEQRQAEADKAMAVGTQYFKEKYGLEVDWTRHEFQPEYVSDNLALYGNVHGKPDQEVYAQVDYRTFEVISTVRPEE